MPNPQTAPQTQRLRPDLLLAVGRALNFNPADFAQRHAEEFTRHYLHADGMLSYGGSEIVPYLAQRVNECLSKAEYSLLSYIEYAGRMERDGDDDSFSEAVVRYLDVREKIGIDWIYAFEGEDSKPRCLRFYPQMYAMAQAMYRFAQEAEDLKTAAKTDGPDAWPDPKDLHKKLRTR